VRAALGCPAGGGFPAWPGLVPGLPRGGVVMGATVRVAERQVRGFWLTDLGQRVEEWVPAGLYDVAEDVDGTAAIVGKNGWTWHVPSAVARRLPAR
jgi:hypothetical protein